jgi:hypothetical protein
MDIDELPRSRDDVSRRKGLDDDHRRESGRAHEDAPAETDNDTAGREQERRRRRDLDEDRLLLDEEEARIKLPR